MTPARRRYLYRVAKYAVPLLIALGYLTESLAPLILALLGAILVPEVAGRNVNDDAADG